MRGKISLSEIAVSHITSPLANSICNRRGILRTARSFHETERVGPDELRNLQFQKLVRVIESARQRVPFYRERFDSIGLEPGDLRSIDDLRQIPVLTREDLVLHSRRLVDSRLCDSLDVADARPLAAPVPLARFRRHRLIKNTSSGSTGTPTPFYDDGTTTALAWAQELRVRSWFGLPGGAKEARMARLSSDTLAKASLGRAFRERCFHRLLLPGMNLTEQDYAHCLSEMRRFQPRMLWGITTALTGFARYLKDTGTPSLGFRPELVVTWAAPLYPHETTLLSEVFDCPISNVYGTREVGHVASQCPLGSYHVHQEHFVLEVVPNEESPDGLGRILVTTLFDTPMPFVRYDLGDLGRLTSQTCDCGRTLQVLNDLVGRTGDVFRTHDGRMVAPNFWCRVFMEGPFCGAVHQFQVIYQSPRKVDFRVVRGPGYSSDTEASIRKVLAREMETVEFGFDYVPEIAPQQSGKFQMVVNHLS